MSKRGNNEGSVYKRSDGRWTGVVHLGYEGGHRKRKAFYGKTRLEVAQKLTRALRSYQEGLPLGSDRLTTGQFLNHWLQDAARPTLRPSTYTSYRGLVDLHLVPELGRIPLARLTPSQVQAMLNRKLEAGLSPRTVQYLHAVIRRALGMAEKWGLVGRNVARLVDPPRVRRPEVRPFTPEEARTFLAAIRGDRLEALYSVALAVGLRQGEALGLRWEDVDLEAGTLTVRHSLQRVDGKLQLVEPKTARSHRTIALPSVVVVALKAHKVRQLEERLAMGPLWKGAGYAFTSTIGTPLDARGVTRRFQSLLEAAGLPRQRFHDLRHACASLLLAQGVSPRVVMETLGHSQISLTMDTYSHVIPALQREAAGLMDALLAGGK